jgi:2-oxoisovalerate dehydrogenase E1 component
MREITYSAATLEALGEEMARDAAIFVVGEGIGPRGGNFNTTQGLYERFGPTRLRDTPISERGFVGLCAGAAMSGTRPVVDFMFVDFILDAMGELVNQVAKMQYMSSGRLKMPLILRGCYGVGSSAATHHSGAYYSVFAHLPGFRVVVPTTPYDAKGLFKTALRGDDPVLFLEHKSLLTMRGHVPEEDYTVPFGQAAVVQAGTAATVVAIGAMVRRTFEAVQSLPAPAASIEIIDPRTIAPLDISTILASVRKTGRLLIVDETYAPCGVGAEIAAQVVACALDELDAPIARLNGVQAPVPYSPVLEAAVVPNAKTIAQAITALLAE